MVDDLKAADQAHLPIGGGEEFAHRAAGEMRLAVAVRKQLDRADVGVGIGDASGHQAACIGLRRRRLAQARHEKPQRQHIECQPAQKR